MYQILIIDDDMNMLKVLSKQIETMGHTCITAQTGKHGLELAQSGNPDLIFLDIMMPGMDGFEVLKKLKRKGALTEITPIIMLTSKSGKQDVQEAMRYGVVDYIIKPYNFNTLSKKIQAALKYSDAVKAMKDFEQSEHLSVIREGGVTIMAFRSALDNPAVLEDTKNTVTVTFLKLTKNDIRVIDLRAIPSFKEKDIRFLKVIISLLGSGEIHIIAGKYYGDIVGAADFDEHIKLYISFGDFEVYMNRE